MKVVLLIALFFISVKIHAQEPVKKESSTPTPSSTSQERSINEKGIPTGKPKSKSNVKATNETAPTTLPNATEPTPIENKEITKPE